MLYVHVKLPDKFIDSSDIWFEGYKEVSWFDDPFVREIVQGIDRSTIVQGEFMVSPIFGGTSVDKLSGGCKAVIAMYVQDEFPVWATLCGDNCAKYIVEVGKRKDTHIVLSHYMNFPEDFEAVFVDSGVKTTTVLDFLHEFRRLHRTVGVGRLK